MSNTSNLASAAELILSDASITEVKHRIQQQEQEQQQQFDPQLPVNSLIRAKARFIDDILSACWQRWLKNHGQSLALIAVGGYGRREMFPYSDIDILILLDQDAAAHEINQLLEQFSCYLWDIGLKPGQSVRTIPECIQVATDDQCVFTTLLEARLITGNQELFNALQQQIVSDAIWPCETFFNTKLEEQQKRHNRYHDTAYNLEPNIKEGPGGLRDIQTITWIFTRHYLQAQPAQLIEMGYLTEAEYQQQQTAVETLWRLRYALHKLAGRSEERLLFDNQRELANLFGFKGQADNQDIEQFMQFYFKTVVGMERNNEILLQLFRERVINPPDNCEVVSINNKFDSVCGFIEAKHDNIFEESPLALLEVFLLRQQIPKLKGIRARTIRLIRSNLHLINDDFRKNPDARSLFIEILRQPHGLTHQLRRMNRYGILAAYLPCFANIVARMQYDLFHIYTVDEHTLFVIRNLRRFSLSKHNDELPFCNKIFLLIAKPEVLYIAGMFHDIAKGMGGDHSVLGQDIAKQFCLDHSISEHNTKLVTWLVRNHLVMSTTAQRKDISDPDTINEFAGQVKTLERLNYLYLLTVADIRATNPELWNSWKDTLLKELYVGTNAAIRRGLENPIQQQEHIDIVKTETRRELLAKGISEATIEQAWRYLGDDYFLRYSSDEAIWHTIGIASCNEHDFPLVLLRPQTMRGSAEIFIYSKDQAGVFSLCTEILDQLGLSILDARIITTRDKYVLNSFQILEQSGAPIADLDREIEICSKLRERYINGNSTGQHIIGKQSRQARYFPIKTQVKFHEDPQNRYTIMELISTDYPGLLSEIGQVFQRQNIALLNAKILTVGSRVEDFFYITDSNAKPLKDADTLKRLHDEVLEILAEDSVSTSA